MLIRFFEHLRQHRIPVSVRELLDLEAALSRRIVFADLTQFYFLARLCLVKDERFFDRFDVAFGSFFGQLDDWENLFEKADPRVALESLAGQLMPELKGGGLEQLLVEYDQSVAEVREKTEAGEKPEEEGESESGDEGDSDEGDEGDGGEEGKGEDGERGGGEEGEEGQGENGVKGEGASSEGEEGERDLEIDAPSRQRATAVWQLREFADYDPDVALGIRNMKMALRRLRRFARVSAELELDLGETIARTAKQAGILDIVEVPERHNAVKVLLLLDVGGSMDEHIEQCAQLFTAARAEFKYIEFFYFHNFIYEGLWTENERRNEERIRTVDVLARFGSDVKVIIVGDASMARHEIAEKGGSVEHFNSEPGEVWLARLRERFRRVVWLNPVPPSGWKDMYTIEMTRRLMEGEMYHLGLDGLEQAMRVLAR